MQGKEVDATIKTLQDAYTRYRMREVRCVPPAHAPVAAAHARRATQSRLLQQRVRLQKKLPDLKKALDTVILLLSKQARGAALPRSLEQRLRRRSFVRCRRALRRRALSSS